MSLGGMQIFFYFASVCMPKQTTEVLGGTNFCQEFLGLILVIIYSEK